MSTVFSLLLSGGGFEVLRKLLIWHLRRRRKPYHVYRGGFSPAARIKTDYDLRVKCDGRNAKPLERCLNCVHFESYQIWADSLLAGGDAVGVLFCRGLAFKRKVDAW